jgi:predicted nucleic acid-binding protein
VYLLDTAALSEPLRRRPHLRFMTRLRQAPADALFTSSICVMELRFGCTRRGDPELWARIHRDILAHVRILAFGEHEAILCVDVLATLAAQGTPIGAEDAQIGATALAHGLIVVTPNVDHFQRIPELRVENWRE